MKRKYILSLILIVGMIAGMATSTQAYTTTITTTGAKIAFDIYHGGYHTTAADLDPIIGNLTAAGNTVLLINETWELPDDVDALFLTQSDDPFTAAEKADVKAWLELDNKLLVASGDSDYGGYFDESNINDLLAYIGTILRLDSTSIADVVYNDDADYRVAAAVFGEGDRPGTGHIAGNLTDGMLAGLILHGPCSLLAFDGTYYKDLRGSTFPTIVEVVMWYSENATSSDSDVTAGDTDVYSTDNQTLYEHGGYPAIAWENLRHTLVNGTNSAIVLAGEAFYTYYKNMYGQTTESGVYNGGTHYGQMFTNNMINYLIIPSEKTSFQYAFAILPLAIIGAIYVLMKRRK